MESEHHSYALDLQSCGQRGAHHDNQVTGGADGTIKVRGLGLDDASAPLDETSVDIWLGQDEFVAALLKDGTIRRLSDGETTKGQYRSASINSRGEVLVAPGPFARLAPRWSSTHCLTESFS